MAARPGLEPRQTEPESVVLPLHHRAEVSTMHLIYSVFIFFQIEIGNF